MLLLIAALPACKPQPQRVVFPEPADTIVLRSSEVDSTASIDSVPAAASRGGAVHSTSPLRPYHASPTPEPSNDDGMRGFDPATEDDLEDNGMTRYMENTDERGWM